MILYALYQITSDGPGLCASNMVKCKEVMRVDLCIHFCLFTFDGYLMLNMSFTVWQMKSDKLAFELGEMSDDPEAKSNPPSITGNWHCSPDPKAQPRSWNTSSAESQNTGSPTTGSPTPSSPTGSPTTGSPTGTPRRLQGVEVIHIEHFKYSQDENPHFFSFKFPNVDGGKYYNGNIQNYDSKTDRFQLYLYEAKDQWGTRTEKTLIGWMDPEAEVIEWGNTDINGEIITMDEPIWFIDWKFKWDPEEMPRGRGCYNFGPMDKQNKVFIQVNYQ